jgi:hypothetical protein
VGTAAGLSRDYFCGACALRVFDTLRSCGGGKLGLRCSGGSGGVLFLRGPMQKHKLASGLHVERDTALQNAGQQRAIHFVAQRPPFQLPLPFQLLLALPGRHRRGTGAVPGPPFARLGRGSRDRSPSAWMPWAHAVTICRSASVAPLAPRLRSNASISRAVSVAAALLRLPPLPAPFCCRRCWRGLGEEDDAPFAAEPAADCSAPFLCSSCVAVEDGSVFLLRMIVFYLVISRVSFAYKEQSVRKESDTVCSKPPPYFFSE